ncbi:MAG: hypothetical protein EAZ44_10175 [Cytophagia bacterium]|nr:MAG: hypothetical protein EAZ44_10175 [Cytophagia bacterium]
MARINNKEEIQKQKRNKHKSSLKRQSQNLERNEATINEGKSILIVCEGVNTEPDYFKEFTQFFRLFTIRLTNSFKLVILSTFFYFKI